MASQASSKYSALPETTVLLEVFLGGKEKGESSSPEANNNATNKTNLERVQTNTGERLLPPIIRVQRSRCVNCGAEPDLICKECTDNAVYCKKCARRAKHPHPLKAFRPKDDQILELKKHLTLSYYEHMVTCNNAICLETCERSRYTRIHFMYCDERRPQKLRDMIEDGQVKFDAWSEDSCSNCGLFITCMFIHANKCRDPKCQVEWCKEIRDTFDMESHTIYEISDEMKKKCQDIHRDEWKKVEQRKRDLLVEDILAIAI